MKELHRRYLRRLEVDGVAAAQAEASRETRRRRRSEDVATASALGSSRSGGLRERARSVPWACPLCTFENEAPARRCAMCFTERVVVNDDSDGEGGGGVISSGDNGVQTALERRRRSSRRFSSGGMSAELAALGVTEEEIGSGESKSVGISAIPSPAGGGGRGRGSNRSFWRHWDMDGRIPEVRHAELYLSYEVGANEQASWEYATSLPPVPPTASAGDEDGGSGTGAAGVGREGNNLALRVPRVGFMCLVHGFPPNGAPPGTEALVYLNRYTVVMDVQFSDLPSGGKDGFAALLQASPDNSSCADWYVRGDGSVGCGIYSAPGVVVAGRWHRVAMAVDLTANFDVRQYRWGDGDRAGACSGGGGIVAWYVDGQRVASLSHDGGGGGGGTADRNSACVVPDDRWALDSHCFLFRDRSSEDCGAVVVSSVQIRSYAMDAEELRRLGGASASGIPTPTLARTAARLAAELNLPPAWCQKALGATGHLLGAVGGGMNLTAARAWLQRNEALLRRQTKADATMLMALGYSSRQCRAAIYRTGSKADAITWLLKQQEEADRRAQLKALGLSTSEQDLLERSRGGSEILGNGKSSVGDGDRRCDRDGEAAMDRTELKRAAFRRGGRHRNHEGERRGSFDSGSFKDADGDGGSGRVGSFRLWLSVGGSSHAPSDGDAGGAAMATKRASLDDRRDSFAEKIRVEWREGGDAADNPTCTIAEHDAGEGGAAIVGMDGFLGDGLGDDGVGDAGDAGKKAARSRGGGGADHLLLSLDARGLQSTSWYTARALFVAYVRNVTVAVLEHSLSASHVTTDGGKDDSGGGGGGDGGSKAATESNEMRRRTSQCVSTLLSQDTFGGRNFLRDYLRAFPTSLRRSSLGRKTGLGAHDPIEVMRRKLLSYFESESAANDTSSQASTIATAGAKAVSHRPSALAWTRGKMRWRRSITRVIVEDALYELVLLAAGPQQVLPSGLRAHPCAGFERVWLAGPAGVDGPEATPVSLWRPRPKSGYFILGDVAVADAESSPPPHVMTVAEPTEGPGAAGGPRPLLAKPVAWEQVWASDGMGPMPPEKIAETQADKLEREAKRRVTLWRPLPPDGYAALGCVAVRGGHKGSPAQPPHVPEFRCVRRDCTQPSATSCKIWDDAGSRRANAHCSLWLVENAAGTFLTHGGSRDAPASSNCAAAGANNPGAMRRGSGATTLAPVHLGHGAMSNEHGSADLALWFLQLLVEYDTRDETPADGRAIAGNEIPGLTAEEEVGGTVGFGAWRERVFCAQLVHALLCFVHQAAPHDRVRALRMLATVLRRTPVANVTFTLARRLSTLRGQMESSYAVQSKEMGKGSKDGEGGRSLYSSLLCALVEVSVSMGLSQAEAARAQALSRLAASRLSTTAVEVSAAEVVGGAKNLAGLMAIAESSYSLVDEDEDDSDEKGTEGRTLASGAKTASEGARLEQKLSEAGAGDAGTGAERIRAQNARHLDIVGAAVLSRASWFQPVSIVIFCFVSEAVLSRNKQR